MTEGHVPTRSGTPALAPRGQTHKVKQAPPEFKRYAVGGSTG
jgi:hypothetical protein